MSAYCPAAALRPNPNREVQKASMQLSAKKMVKAGGTVQNRKLMIKQKEIAQLNVDNDNWS